MQKYFLTEARKHLHALHHKKRRKRIVTALSVMVVLCTAYALMLPAITMENQNNPGNQTGNQTIDAKYSCQLTEHIHSPSCYQPTDASHESESPPAVDKSDEPIRGELICGLHEHTDDCLQVITTLICGFPEQPETPESENPESDDTYESDETLESEVLKSEVIESEEADRHQHNDTCWQTTSELICGITDEHRHTDECYEWLTPLCGMTEHTHNDSCKVPASADESTKNESTENNPTENKPADEPITDSAHREFTADELALIDNIIAMIAALPDEMPDDIPDENTPKDNTEYDAATDENNESNRNDENNKSENNQNNEDLKNSVTAAYDSYSELAPELQAMVTNSQKLLALVRLHASDLLSQPAADEQPQTNQTDAQTEALRVTPELPPDADPSIAHYFQVLQAGDPEKLYIGANIAYDILDSDGNKIDSDTTDENGIFALLYGYTAIFYDIPDEPNTYIIQELTNTPVPANTLTINSVEIPIKLEIIDKYADSDDDTDNGKTYEYTIRLEQVTDQTGVTPSNPSFVKNLSFTVNTGKNATNGKFTLDYSSDYSSGYSSIDADAEFPAYRYYKITAVPPTGSGGITSAVLDKTVYVAEVTLTKTAENTVTAALGNIYKLNSDTGTELAPAEEITFTNQLLRYELPDTGGTGTLPFTLSGLLCLSTALVLLCRRNC